MSEDLTKNATNFGHEEVMLAPAFDRRKVLLVDDERNFLMSLSEGLQGYLEEFEVLTACNGKEAIKVLEEEEVSLLVTDLRMPEVDGFELIAYVCRNFPNLPIIVITAFGTEQIRKNLKKFVVGYIEKPIDLQELVDQIRNALGEVASGNSIQNDTLFGFLQLIEMERKSCSVVVESGNKIGIMYFASGKFIGAEFEALEGEAAAHEILSWKNPKIDVSKLPEELNWQSSIKVSELLQKFFSGETGHQVRSSQEVDGFHTKKSIFDIKETKDTTGSEIGRDQKGLGEQFESEKGDPHVVDFNRLIEDLFNRFREFQGILGILFFSLETTSLIAFKGEERVKALAWQASELFIAKEQLIKDLQLRDEVREIVINLKSHCCFVCRVPNVNPSMIVSLVFKDISLALVRLELQRFFETF